MYFEFIILAFILIYMIMYRKNTGESAYKFIIRTVSNTYEKYAPYSFKVVREKTKELGQEYTPKQYTIQVVMMAGFAGIIGYLYFYSIIWAIVYATIAILLVPYLAFLRCKKVYSEFIFEQIQVYTTNVIMEFNTTQSFVKALEGVVESGVLENPVLADVKQMILMAYSEGTINEALEYMNSKYSFYVVKNMHQLFLQITQEGSKDSGEALENMLQDIDMLVENVYRDRMNRDSFHKQFITFGLMLFFLIMLMQILLGNDSYLALLEKWYIQLLLHAIVIINTGFLISGEKYYYENVGGE
jgi:hypothetical protein